jgi:hypothetical protein
VYKLDRYGESCVDCLGSFSDVNWKADTHHGWLSNHYVYISDDVHKPVRSVSNLINATIID